MGEAEFAGTTNLEVKTRFKSKKRRRHRKANHNKD